MTNRMNIFILEETATQAKLVLQKGYCEIKIPKHLSYNQRLEIRDKFLHLIEMNKKEVERSDEYGLKAYYKIGTPYVFLNRRINSRKRETVATYSYNDI
jgi:hypothetical protein